MTELVRWRTVMADIWPLQLYVFLNKSAFAKNNDWPQTNTCSTVHERVPTVHVLLLDVCTCIPSAH